MTKQLTVRFRHADNGFGHVDVRVFAALAPDDVRSPTLAKCGDLTFRTEEWAALKKALPLGSCLTAEGVPVNIEVAEEDAPPPLREHNFFPPRAK